MVATTAYLRPGEVRTLRADDLLPPSRGQARLLREWSVVLKSADRSEPTKTGTCEETLYFDHPPVLGEALGAYKSQLEPGMALCPFPDELIRSAWRAASEAAGATGKKPGRPKKSAE